MRKSNHSPQESANPSGPRECARLTLTARSPEETQAIGRALGGIARAGDVFLLTGDLGAGKTCLTQGVLWGLGGEEYARSPTFVLICEYPARLTLYHMDLYRLDTLDEVIDLGLDEYIYGDGVCVVEWADKAAAAFDGDAMRIAIAIESPGVRSVALTASSQRYADMLDALAQAAPQLMRPRPSQPSEAR